MKGETKRKPQKKLSYRVGLKGSLLVIGFKNNLIHTSHRMLLMLPLPRAPEPLPTTTPGFSDPIHPKLFAIVIYVFIYYYTGDDTKNDRYNVLNYNTKQWRQSRCLFLCWCRIWLRNRIFVPRAWKTFCTFVGNNGCLEQLGQGGIQYEPPRRQVHCDRSLWSSCILHAILISVYTKIT